MIDFNADEIFEMAEQIEVNGGRFYRAAAKSADADAQKFLTDLAVMEDEHVKTFAAMRAELNAADKTSFTFDPEDEAAQYLQAMVEGKIFGGDPVDLLAGGKTPAEILAIAVSHEKDSIIFYQCMKPFVPVEMGQDRLQDIISQEIGHILMLTKKLGELEN